MSSAKRLETLVPGAGHLVHMPSHIWIRTGDYVAAAKTNAVAAALDEKYVKATGAKGLYPSMPYGHNLQFESSAAMFAGDFAAGTRGRGQNTANLVAPMAGEMAMLQPFALQEVLALVRFAPLGRGLGATGAAGRTATFSQRCITSHVAPHSPARAMRLKLRKKSSRHSKPRPLLACPKT